MWMLMIMTLDVTGESLILLSRISNWKDKQFKYFKGPFTVVLDYLWPDTELEI